MTTKKTRFNKEKTVKNISLSFVAQVAVQLSKILMNLLLARYFLDPDDFGIVSIGIVMVMFSKIMTDFGFGQALIQKQDVKQIDFSSVFWLNISLSTLLVLILFVFANEIAEFYEAPSLPPLLYGLLPVIMLNSLAIIQLVQLSKQLRFKFIAINDSMSAGIGVIVALGLGYLGAGPWALVGYHLTYSAVSNIWLWLKVKEWRPSFEFSVDSIKSISGFSFNLFANNSLNYWSKNADKLIVAKYFGQHTLGLYAQAFSMILIPVSNISVVVQKVLFPTFSEIQDQKHKIASVFIKSSRGVMFITMSIFMGLFLVSDLFVRFLFGKKWAGMEDILAIFCFVGLVVSLRTILASVYMANNKTGLLFRLNIIGRTSIIAGLLLTVRFGVEAMALSLFITNFFSWIGLGYYASRILKTHPKHFFFSHLKVILCGTVGVAVGLIFRSQLPIGLYALYEMIPTLIVFVLAYFSTAFLLKEDSLFEIMSILKSRLKGRSKAHDKAMKSRETDAK